MKEKWILFQWKKDQAHEPRALLRFDPHSEHGYYDVIAQYNKGYGWYNWERMGLNANLDKDTGGLEVMTPLSEEEALLIMMASKMENAPQGFFEIFGEGGG